MLKIHRTPLTKDELLDLLRDALNQPNEADRVLDISARIIDFYFNLADYIEELQPEYPQLIVNEKEYGDYSIPYTCPIHFNASQTVFKSCADFKRATFLNKTNFGGVIFVGDADFFRATFIGGADFSHTEFIKGAYFGEVTFVDTPCTFRNATLRPNAKLKFHEISLKGDAQLRFENIIFGQDSHLDIQRITPTDDKPRILIRDDVLDESDNQPQNITFFDCSFSPNNVLVQQLHTKRLKVQGGNGLVGFNFSHCLWLPQTVPWLLGTGLTLRVHPNHPDDPKANPQAQKLLYERLKQQAQTDGDHQLAGEFYFWQQWFKWLTPKQHPLDKLVQTFYLAASAFGLSVARPLFWLVVVILVCWPFYGILMFNLNPTLCFYDVPYKALTFSLGASIPFALSGLADVKALVDSPKAWWQAILCVVAIGLFVFQQVIQGFLLFQLGAAIRGKVKR